MPNSGKRDIYLNTLAVGIAGLAGLGMFFLVGRCYGPEALGVFNKVFAVYLVVAQVSAFGLPLSMLRKLPPLCGDVPACRAAIWGGLTAALPAVLCTALPLWFAAPWLGRLGLGVDTAAGLLWAAPALAAFAGTKILLAALNALSRLSAYALCNAMRYILLLVGVLLHMAGGFVFQSLPAVLLFAEGLLLLLLVFFLRDILFGRADFRALYREGKAHIAFGLRAFAGNLVQDLNTRIDVICLGLLMPDAAVGIYSLAALPAEAAAQLPTVLRVIYNPRTVMLLTRQDTQGLSQCIRRIRNLVWLGMGCAALVAALLYPHVIPWLTGRPEFAAGAPTFALLMLGTVIGAGWAPFGNLPANAGFPGVQSLICLAAFGLNLCANLALIPWLGLEGAALASAASQALTILLLRAFARKQLGLAV